MLSGLMDKLALALLAGMLLNLSAQLLERYDIVYLSIVPFADNILLKTRYSNNYILL